MIFATCHSDRKQWANGLCHMCYQRDTNDRMSSLRPNRRPVAVPSCHPDRKHRALGLCSNCYMRKYKSKGPTSPIKDSIDPISSCHPPKPNRCMGMCQPCYSRYLTWNITPEQFNAILVSQDNRCPVCLKTPSTWYVDHDHSTGAIRGLLCNTCNRGLGLLGDTEDALRRAHEYLIKSRETAGKPDSVEDDHPS